MGCQKPWCWKAIICELDAKHSNGPCSQIVSSPETRSITEGSRTKNPPLTQPTSSARFSLKSVTKPVPALLLRVCKHHPKSTTLRSLNQHWPAALVLSTKISLCTYEEQFVPIQAEHLHRKWNIAQHPVVLPQCWPIAFSVWLLWEPVRWPVWATGVNQTHLHYWCKCHIITYGTSVNQQSWSTHRWWT